MSGFFGSWNEAPWISGVVKNTWDSFPSLPTWLGIYIGRGHQAALGVVYGDKGHHSHFTVVLLC